MSEIQSGQPVPHSFKDHTGLFSSIGQALSRVVSFFTKGAKLEEQEDLEDTDISELISRWRQSRSSRVLLRIVKKIQREEVPRFRDRRLRKAFIYSLSIFVQSLEEINRNLSSSCRAQALREIITATDNVVDGVDLYVRRDGDENFIPEDKRRIVHNFRRANEHVQNINNAETLSGYVNNSLYLLNKFHSIYDLIWDWLESERKEEEERESQKGERREKLCKKTNPCNKSKIRIKRSFKMEEEIIHIFNLNLDFYC